MKIKATVEMAGGVVRPFSEQDLLAVLNVVNARHGSEIRPEYTKRVGRYVQTKLRVRENNKRNPGVFGRIGTRSGRSLFALCWHGFKAVMQEVYCLDHGAVISTGFATYKGVAHFEAIHRETFHRNAGSQMYPEAYGDLCRCDQGENWPAAPYNFEASEESERLIIPRWRGGPWYMTNPSARVVVADSGDDSADVAGADDALVPDEVAKADPDRWAEYNKRFNDLILRGQA